MTREQWLAEVVRPLVEAQVRETVAQELEAQPRTETATWQKAAALARGGQP